MAHWTSAIFNTMTRCVNINLFTTYSQKIAIGRCSQKHLRLGHCIVPYGDYVEGLVRAFRIIQPLIPSQGESLIHPVPALGATALRP